MKELTMARTSRVEPLKRLLDEGPAEEDRGSRGVPSLERRLRFLPTGGKGDELMTSETPRIHWRNAFGIPTKERAPKSP